MDSLSNLWLGLEVALAPEALLFCFIGVTLGTVVGVLPGIGALAAISLSLPITYYLDPTTAIIMLAGIFYGSQYGSSTAAILLNIPGTPTAAATCLDGYPLARQGKAGMALFITSIASFIGGSIAIILLMWFAPMLAQFALRFSSVEYFSIMLLGLVSASTLTGGSIVKGLAMVVVGVGLGVVGTDVNSGTIRFSFGVVELFDGLSLVAVAMGLFGIAEILTNLMSRSDFKISARSITLRSMLPTRADMRASIMPTLRGSAIGSWIGALPGTGPTVAAFISYAVEKKVARDPSRFGNGAVEGISAPEAANNAAVQAAFIPTLSLGIPGDAVMAVLLGALLLHGVAPGPQFIANNPEMFWGLVASFWVGNVLLLILNIPLIGIWVRILSIPYRVLYPCVLFLVCVGVYSVNNQMFDVVVALVFGVIGYFATQSGYPVAPLLLGFVLGPMMEQHIKRALLLSRGDFGVFIERPISAFFITVTVLLLVWPHVGLWRERRRAAQGVDPS